MKPRLHGSLLCAALMCSHFAGAQSPGEGALFSLVSGCTSNCESDIFKKVWRGFEDATGLRTAVDTSSIQFHNKGGFMAVVYNGQPGQQFNTAKIARIYFTCQGQYQDFSSFPPVLTDFGRRSVGGDIERAFCSKPVTTPAQKTKAERLYQRLSLTGRVQTDTYQDCCHDGQEKPTQYRFLQLDAPIDFTGSDQGDENYRGVTKVQIDYRWSGFKTMPDGAKATIVCSEVAEGGTGHYALPLYCWVKKPG